MGLVLALLAHAIEVGRIPPRPVEPLANTLLGALREAAIYRALAQDRPQAAEAVGGAIDMINSLATGDEKHVSVDRTTDP